MMGLLNREKVASGAPVSYRLVSEVEVDALTYAGIPYYPRLTAKPSGQLGWVHPDVYALIIAYEQADGYAGMSLGEWLVKTYSLTQD